MSADTDSRPCRFNSGIVGGHFGGSGSGSGGISGIGGGGSCGGVSSGGGGGGSCGRVSSGGGGGGGLCILFSIFHLPQSSDWVLY